MNATATGRHRVRFADILVDMHRETWYTATMDAAKVTLLFDTKLLQPACALLQAVAGSGGYNPCLHLFDSRLWLTAPTPDMQPISGTKVQWQALATKVNALAPEERRNLAKRIDAHTRRTHEQSRLL